MTTNPEHDLTPEEQAKIKDAEWQKTLRRLGLGEVDISKVSNDDILYLAKKWSFLQIVESSGKFKPFDKPELITAQSGWTIINYGDAMATSPGKFLYGGGFFRFSSDEDEDEGGSGVVNPKKGTIVKQAFDSAAEMVRLAKELGWDGVQIVDGHPDMQEAVWVEACRIGISADGFVPDTEAEKKRRRIVSESIDEMLSALKGISQKR
ncbi:MAG: hypothetical protein A3C44_03970 [Gammaproteobacteria bacterium RIFCSPHIGHO2_02_FULL_39_13]|nr:MAG: hypothetical protein A3C44_03970 [Gammaproteobacteria bacterium RIFCSPHIGHO2_02_FULL_39_13]OGT50294.1 MAG: hypothetical protein A3E53_00895 [Gammaproteobacteria bacterium RIFCSPHIGHO2_12_FULL_39_24]